LYRVAEGNGWFLSNKLHGLTSQKKATSWTQNSESRTSHYNIKDHIF